MADLEHLENEPASLVNRVFREQPVEPSSLERVARALEVDAWTLYLNGDHQRPETPDSDTDGPAKRRPLGWMVSATVAGVLLLALAWILFNRAPPPVEVADAELAAVPPGRPTVAVLDFDGDSDLNLAAALRRRLDGEFSVVMGAAETLAVRYGERAAAERLRAQWLVGGEHLRHGRWSGLRIWLEHDGTRLPGWSLSIPTAHLQRDRRRLIEQAFEAVRDRIRGRTRSAASVVDRQAQTDYLIGRKHLDRAATELNVRRAQGRFEAAIRRAPEFARAHAGLCLALLEEIWIQDEQWALEQAQVACGKAEALDADDPVVRLAQAALLRRSGEIDAALELVGSTLRAAPDDADLLDLQATLHFHRYRQTGEAVDLERARTSAIAASEADSTFWRPLFTRAIIEYFDNNIDAAVTASQQALALEENANILTNLGSFELCAGKVEQARARYLRVRELSPLGHAGDEFLGLVHYYRGEYEVSRQLRQRAIDALADGSPEIHQMWGGLAESRWRADDNKGAIQAWLRAIEIVERDRLRGTAGHDDAAARVHYYTAVKRLQPGAVDGKTITDLEAELEELMRLELSANAWVGVAKAWINLGQARAARAALSRATATCPGYGQLPEFVGLTEAEQPQTALHGQ